MTDAMMNLRGVLEKSADADLLREMIGFAAGRLAVATGAGVALGSRLDQHQKARTAARARAEA